MQTTPHDSPGTLSFLTPKISAKDLGKTEMGSPPTEAPNVGGVVQSSIWTIDLFNPYCYIFNLN